MTSKNVSRDTLKRKSPGQKQLKDLKTKYSNKSSKSKKEKVVIPEESKSLTHKQILIAEEYILTNNITQSYLKYHPNVKESSARVLGERLLHKVNFKKYIEERLKPKEEKEIKKAIADADELLEFITSVIRGEVKDQLGFETSVKDRLTATKMLADRYSLFTNPDKPEEEEKNQSKVIIEVVDNSDLEKTLYDENK